MQNRYFQALGKIEAICTAKGYCRIHFIMDRSELRFSFHSFIPRYTVTNRSELHFIFHSIPGYCESKCSSVAVRNFRKVTVASALHDCNLERTTLPNPCMVARCI